MFVCVWGGGWGGGEKGGGGVEGWGTYKENPFQEPENHWETSPKLRLCACHIECVYGSGKGGGERN